MHAALSILATAGLVLVFVLAAAPAARAWPTAPVGSRVFHCHLCTGGPLFGLFHRDHWVCYPGPAHAAPPDYFH